MGFFHVQQGVIRAVLFDLDETLLDRNTSLRSYLARHVQRMGLQEPQRYIDRYIELDGHGYTPKQQLFHQLCQEFGLPWNPARLYQDFSQHIWEANVLFPEALEVLEALKAKAYPLGIITNGSVDMQQRKIASTGLEPYFGTILISEAEGLKKPDPQIFLRACERLGVKPGEAIFVGDHLINDIQGAKQAGLLAVWREGIWPSDPQIRPDTTITDLRGLLAHL